MDVIVDESAVKAKKKKIRGYGKLRKCGFDPDELALDRMIPMNHEGFRRIEERQMAAIKAEWLQAYPNRRKEEPLKSFDELRDFNKNILQNMQLMNYKQPLPVQTVVIPYIMNTTCDMIVEADTGTGKTLSFLLPIIQEIHQMKLHRDQAPNSTAPYAVIVAPTHELVQTRALSIVQSSFSPRFQQLAGAATRLCQNLPSVRVAFAHGQMDMRDSRELLQKGCDLLFCTAGRLYHYFSEEEPERGAMLSKDRVRFVVIDEADKLLEERWGNPVARDNLPESAKVVLDFVNDLTNDLKTKKDRPTFRVLMFSATYSSRAYVEQMVCHDNCIDIKIGHSNPAETVRQRFVEVTKAEDKLSILTELIESLSTYENGRRNIKKTIIFTNSVRMSDRIATTLTDLSFAVRALNAQRSGRQRFQAMAMLMRGDIHILVTTDVAERGLNIPNASAFFHPPIHSASSLQLEYVINYDLPPLPKFDTYIHRVGRCGRLGHAGTAISLFNPNEDRVLAPALDHMIRTAGFEPQAIITRCLGRVHDNNNNNRQRQAPGWAEETIANKMNALRMYC
ncbi:RNA helicase [Aphelenchoides fujianensis]|nr:RNA helicase [Aphelenchoides fujianensis]